jgi:hypothetical protein
VPLSRSSRRRELSAGTAGELDPSARAGATTLPASPGKTLSPAWTLVGVGSLSNSLSVSSRSEDAMFKRRKRAPGERLGWGKRLSAVVAGIGGVVGGLLFWRKRKGS